MKENPGIIRFVEIGGLSKFELLEALKQNSIFLNPLAEQLFASRHFTTSTTPFRVATIEITVSDLSFPRRSTIGAIYSKAEAAGLKLCPLELAAYFRLQYLQQPESHCDKLQQGKAPIGSITVASKLIEIDDSQQGFYLRRIKEQLWLRGYHCSLDYE